MSQKQKTSKKMTTTRQAVNAKAGKRHGLHQHPPYPTRSRAELEARALRRGRLNGAFGRHCPIHIYNFLITGTNGQERVIRSKKELALVAEYLTKNGKAVDVEAA